MDELDLLGQEYDQSVGSTDPLDALGAEYDKQYAIVPPSAGQIVEYLGKGTAEGLGGMLDLITSAASLPSKLGRAALTGSISDITQNPKSLFDSFFSRKIKENIGSSEDAGIVANPEYPWFKPEYAKAAMQGAVIPGGQVMNALSNVSSEVAKEMFPESDIAPLVAGLLPSTGTSALKSGLKAVEGLGESIFNKSAGITARDYKAAQLNSGWESAKAAKEKIQGAMQTLKKEGLGYGAAIKGQEGFLEDALKITKGLTDEKAVELNNIIANASKKVGPGVVLDYETIANAYKKVPDEFKEAWLQKIVDLNESGFTSPKTLADLQRNKVAWNAEFKANPNTSPAAAVNAEEAYRKAMQVAIEKGAPGVKKINQELAPLLELRKGLVKDLPTAQTENAIEEFRRGLFTTSGSGLGGLEALGAGPLSKVFALFSFMKPAARVGGLALEDVAQIGQGLISPLTKINSPTSPLAAALLSQIPKPQKEDKPMTEDLPTPKVVSAKRVTSATKEAIESEIDSNPFHKAVYEAESGRGKYVTTKDSSAKGPFQFIDKTARDIGLKDPFDLGQSYEAFKKLTAQNEAILKSDNPVHLYAAHVLGPSLAKKMIQNKPLTKREEQLVDYFESKALPNFMKRYKPSIIEI